jgi:hypothetical protein
MPFDSSDKHEQAHAMKVNSGLGAPELLHQACLKEAFPFWAFWAPSGI